MEKAVISIDAIGTQTKIAEQIIEKQREANNPVGRLPLCCFIFFPRKRGSR
jgi:hypothetical protein